MPTFNDPLADAAEASEALRGLAHASRTFDNPADTYAVFGDVISGVRSLRQVLDQLADAHLTHRERAHDDPGNHAAGAGSALTAADELHQAGTLLDQVQGLDIVRCAVVHPCDAGSLSGAMDAANHGLIKPVLIGPEGRIRHVAEEAGISLQGVEIISVEHSHAAAEMAAEMAANKEVEILMKGSLHTDELLKAVLSHKALRTGRRLSHVFRFDVPLYPKPLIITDAAINIEPTLQEKVDIVQNAIDFARVMGIETPKVAILSAVETVTASIPSTLDAAALCKMADRGQITGGLLDGPLAFDNAVSPDAVQIKGIVSEVAGQADILAVPDLESGNMIAKQLEYLAGASGSGLVLGARVPIALPRRADGAMARVASTVLAVLAAHDSRRKNQANAWKQG